VVCRFPASKIIAPEPDGRTGKFITSARRASATTFLFSFFFLLNFFFFVPLLSRFLSV
jgi:hypothetical protein